MPAPRKRKLEAAPSLVAKKQPEQMRAAETFEHILATTAQLLPEVGFERLSTNLVCERAGLTPPALYRYFPNKYALLGELGRRLMERQNEVIPRWIGPDALSGPLEDLERALASLLIDTYRVTCETPGGVWILRALRAVPVLQDIRLASHAAVTEAQTRLLVVAFADVPAGELALIGRVAVELIYAAVEMLFDEPLNVPAVAEIVARMIASQMSRLRKEISV